MRFSTLDLARRHRFIEWLPPLRSDEQRTRPWRAVMRELLLASLTATAEQLGRLRRHRLGPLPS
ncbi:MAG: hypothetical protein L6Q84_28880 [Polyangiaceae bacterium]|nr:hypothetical protein [Polyangiaceae bacterium]